MSDHSPISITLKYNLCFKQKCDSKRITHKSFRWDKCNSAEYAALTEQKLSAINIPVQLLSQEKDTFHEDYIRICIDNFYSDIVTALYDASVKCVPQSKGNFFKFWWDAELDTLKQNAIISHNVWKDSGKPRAGPIFHKMYSDKNVYKNTIKIKKVYA